MGLTLGFVSHHVHRWGFRLREAFVGTPGVCRSIEEYARGCVDWLFRAQQATPDDGFAESYLIGARRWNPSYPETTGYIICSLLRAARQGIGDAAALREASRRAGIWLLGTQMECGAFPCGNIAYPKRAPAAFNTGQILKGMTDLIVAGLDADGRLRESAARAVRWLIEAQDADGAWRKGVSVLTSESVHTYYVRTAWAMVRYGRTFGDSDAVAAGEKNAAWVCSQRERDGWFRYMNFDVGQPPLTHTVAYTIQGLMETGVLCGRNDFLDAAQEAAARMRALQDPRTGAVPGQILPGYRSGADWTSTTGNAQMAIIWFRLAEITGDATWRQAGIKANEFNCSIQELDMHSRDPGRQGAVRGSFPGHRGYGRFWYMNWTQKFHLDALLAQMGVSIV